MRLTLLATSLALASGGYAQSMAPSPPGTGASGGQKQKHPSDYSKVVLAHGVMGCLAFALFFPSGAIAIRVLSHRNQIWFHAGWMIFTYTMALAVMSMGIWMAITSSQLNVYHPIIGLVVICSLIFQPITGWTHHLLYKRKGRLNMATYPHIWWGRIIITLGIINGGLGLQLTGHATRGQIIAYGVVAGVIWLLWIGVNLLAYVRNRGKPVSASDGKLFDAEKKHGSTESIRTTDAMQRSSIP